MQTRRSRSSAGLVLLAAVIGGAAAIAPPNLAQACSRLCPQIVELPGSWSGQGTSWYPVNAVAFAVDRQATAAHLAEYHVDLRVVGGDQPIPLVFRPDSDGAPLLVPGVPLVPLGTYVLSFDQRCGPSWPQSLTSPTPRQNFTFRTSEAASSPPDFGPLEVASEGFLYPSSAVPDSRMAFVKLRFGIGDTLAFHALTRFEVEVGGKRMMTPYSPSGFEFTIAAPCNGRPGWGESSCGGYVDVAPGLYTVKVIPSVLGAPTAPPVLSRTIMLQCDAHAGANGPGTTLPEPTPPEPTQSDGGPDVDATPDRQDAGAPAVADTGAAGAGPVDASASDASTLSLRAPTSSSGGCSVTGPAERTPGPGTWLPLALALAGFVARQRKR